MGCCKSKAAGSEDSDTDERSEPLLKNEHLTDGDTASNSSSWLEEAKIGPVGENFPTWIKDEEAKNCFTCDIKFQSLMERRHHCRRCRNVFCTGCSAHKSTILLYGMNESVRVCGACKMELKTENYYLKTQRPMLLRGENFSRSKMMGFSSHVVKLRLLMNDETLTYEGPTKADPEEITLSMVRTMNMTSLTSFELATAAKAYVFEADSTATLKAWMEALQVAVARAKAGSLRIRVDDDRIKKVEALKMDKIDRKQQKAAQDTKDRRSKALNSIKDKYNLR